MTNPDVAARLGLTAEEVEALTTRRSTAGEEPDVSVTIVLPSVAPCARSSRARAGLRQRGLGGVEDWLLPEQNRAMSAATPAEDWAAGLHLPAARQAEFERVAAAMRMTPLEALRAMVALLLGLGRLMASPPEEEWLEMIAHVGVRGLLLRIVPTACIWPAGKPFPWSEKAALAAVLGYEVQWPGSFDDFVTKLRGRWEMGEGRRAVLWQS